MQLVTAPGAGLGLDRRHRGSAPRRRRAGTGAVAGGRRRDLRAGRARGAHRRSPDTPCAMPPRRP
jgi:hypothetical protein